MDLTHDGGKNELGHFQEDLSAIDGVRQNKTTRLKARKGNHGRARILSSSGMSPDVDDSFGIGVD